MTFPTDVSDNEWDTQNPSKWKNPQVSNLDGVQLLPLEAKALHAVGTLVRIFDSVGYLLYCGPQNKPYGNYALYAYLLACTAIELLGRCQAGKTTKGSTLKIGLKNVGLDRITVNVDGGIHTYDEDELDALRNLAAHGQALASSGRNFQDVILHVELLDSFPNKLVAAFDDYYWDLFGSPDPKMRKSLAIAAVEPVLYRNESGQLYVSPIKFAYEKLYQPGKKPSQILQHTDWQIYNPERDRYL